MISFLETQVNLRLDPTFTAFSNCSKYNSSYSLEGTTKAINAFQSSFKIAKKRLNLTFDKI